MASIKYADAVLSAIREEMLADDRVVLWGQDAEYIFTEEERRALGVKRIRSTPISETAFIGAGIGAALTGLRPVVALGCCTFLYSAMDQVINQAAKVRYMFGGQASAPLVVRAPVFYDMCVAAHHSDRPWGLFAQAPGLKIVVPANAYDAKGLLKAAIRDSDPVLFFEDMKVSQQACEVPDEDYTVPIGVAEVKRLGTDLTIVAIADAVNSSLVAAGSLASKGISVEVVDLRTIVPWDHTTVLNSVRKTRRLLVVDPATRTCGMAAEVAATVAELGFHWLEHPIVRHTAPDVPVPFSAHLEKFLYPSAQSITDEALRICTPQPKMSKVAKYSLVE